MIIVMKHGAGQREIEAVEKVLRDHQLGVHISNGSAATIIGVIGDKSALAGVNLEMMDGVVQSSMFRHWGKYANYILTIFMFLLFSNISGLFGLRPPTADYGVTLPLALITFVLIQFNAFKWKGVGGYVKDLMDPIPLFLPINIISEFATPVSLSLRLFGNVMAGTIMLALYYGMLPVLATVVIPSFLHAYLDLFSGAIQAYVFCMLSMTFIYQKMPE